MHSQYNEAFMGKILIIGSNGQIGTELLQTLRQKNGEANVIASDIREPKDQNQYFEQLDVMNKERLLEIVKKHGVKEVYLLAALLSATAEQRPDFAWKLNMESLFNVLNLAKDKEIDKVFWPSSIAVFGPTTPRENTPQYTVMEPSTVYGISKLAGERWCEYYANKYDVDVRSIRYPGLISYSAPAGGGTTDYAVEIFYAALKKEKYTSFLSKDTALPMMYMDDAVRATIELMEAPIENVKIKSSYNLGGISFTPKQIYASINKIQPEFEIGYKPDFRQSIADSWPSSIEDSAAQKDWGWKQKFSLDEMVKVMLENVKIN